MIGGNSTVTIFNRVVTTDYRQEIQPTIETQDYQPSQVYCNTLRGHLGKREINPYVCGRSQVKGKKLCELGQIVMCDVTFGGIQALLIYTISAYTIKGNRLQGPTMERTRNYQSNVECSATFHRLPGVSCYIWTKVTSRGCSYVHVDSASWQTLVDRNDVIESCDVKKEMHNWYSK